MAQLETKYFHLGDVLSVSDGRLVSKRGMDGVYDIMGFLFDDPDITTIGIMSLYDEAKSGVLKQHPQLAEVVDPDAELDPETVPIWLGLQIAKFGGSLPITQLRNSQSRTIDDELKILAAYGFDVDNLIVIPKD